MKVYFTIVVSFCVLDSALFLINAKRWTWSWECVENKGLCRKSSRPFAGINGVVLKDSSVHISLPVCRLICGKYGALWPKPTEFTEIKNQLITFNASNIQFKVNSTSTNIKEMLIKSTKIFYRNILAECGKNCSINSDVSVLVSISVTSHVDSLRWDTLESYYVEVTTTETTVSVKITAETFFGARHGLETLSQLITSYQNAKGSGLIMVSEAKIKDKPIYPHRGLLIDTSRNYLPVEAIKRQIDAMAASKLNVLHWHATDSQSFPLKFPRVPQLSRFGAYSSSQVYDPEEIRYLLQYAIIRGVRIILEIDTPSHSGNGWQWGNETGLGNLAVCVNELPWRSFCIQPPCGQLNPANPNMYKVLEDLYEDIVAIFPKGEVLHMGGDEVFIPCWNSSAEIISYLENQGKGFATEDFLELWSEFQEKALVAFDKKVGNSDTPIILWSSLLTDPEHIEKYLSKDRYIVETWVPSTDNLPMILIEKGYKLIISTKNAWYLDHGFWGSNNYYNWRRVYSNNLPVHINVLGGEVCMWGELVDSNSLDSRVWPRAAAAAERLWSNPETDDKIAETRFFRHRERLLSRGVQAETVTPLWCSQNEGECS